jgi:signal transduction histidine kinase
MTCDSELDVLYRDALKEYLARPDEALLERAYGLGRQALVDGRGVLDMATMHSQAVATLMASGLGHALIDVPHNSADRQHLFESLERFFIEAISPFEIAHRGFRDANLVLHRLNDVLENQAKRIAYALHAEASQLVASVHLALADLATRLPAEPVKEIQSVRGLLDQIEDRIRRISHELRPTILDDMGLVPAIEFLADGIAQRWGIPVAVHGSVRGSLPLPVETALYRAAQEGLTNVARHAHATQAEVALQQSPHLISCSVRDDGTGCDPAVITALGSGRRGLGLVEIRERMAALGGTLRLNRRVEQGTEFIVEIPLEAPTWA